MKTVMIQIMNKKLQSSELKKIILLQLIIISNAGNIFSQKDSVNIRPAQVSFCYPVGSNGLNSPEYANYFSLNILFGLNGGVRGAEIGSIMNYNYGDVCGAQVAGVINVNNKKTSGAQVAGVININKKITTGVQVAGVANINNDSSYAVHLAGVGNFNNKNTFGGQIAGVTNISRGDTKGFQIAGVANVNDGNLSGTQIAGVANLNKDSVNGTQISGVVNINEGATNGSQIGVINVTKKLSGIQIGVINISKECDNGLPIGLISCVKNGYHELEVYGSEVMYINLSYKMGVDRFYTIFKSGYSSYNSNSVLGYGFGFGSIIKINNRNKINVDISSNQVIYNGNLIDSRLNFLNKLDVHYKFCFTEAVSVFLGPSFNLYNTEEMAGNSLGTLNVPYCIFSNSTAAHKNSFWIGGNAGLAFKF